MQNKTYTMRGGQIKIANKRYTSIQNDHCITFDTNAVIEEVADDGESIQMAYNFTALQKIKDCEVGPGAGNIPQMIDVIGLILNMEPIS